MGEVRVLKVWQPAPMSDGFAPGIRRVWDSLRGYRKRVRVNPAELPYWQERGWRKIGHTYHGNYQTEYARCGGTVVDEAGFFKVYISNPPAALRNHPHWICFVLVGPGARYQIHLVTQPVDVSSAVFNVERMLNESFSRTRRGKWDQ